MRARKTFVAQKRMGRPVTVEDAELIGVRLPRKMLNAIDAWAKANKMTRSEVIRTFCEQGLKTGGRGR
jgi:Ribbon-helix-helix protein, copG family